MKRPVNTRKIIENIKNDFPNITLRTSLITGFPNETEDDFKELLSFVKQNYFEHIGIFGYSDQKLAKSYKLKNKIFIQNLQSNYFFILLIIIIILSNYIRRL